MDMSIFRLIISLAKKDFKDKYLGSLLGIVWAFIHPIILTIILWYVFQIGFKSIPVDDVPFILWLMAGLVPWFFISDAFVSATNSILENSYLVKKMVFRVSVLPLVKIVSALHVHLFFIIGLFVIFQFYGYGVSWYNVQVIYYLFASILLLLGTTLITSSLVVFLKDIGQIVAMVVQFGFWVTPIFWSLQTVPEKYHNIIKMNPVFYIVNGYRDTFIYQTWFWEDWNQTIYFWVTVFVFIFIGVILFKKLRPHFADVL